MFMVSMMYRMRRKSNVRCCPLGTMHDGVVDCYWFGVVSLKECAKCTVRKDKNMIRKGD